MLDHQLHATNLMTLAGWEHRFATWQAAGGFRAPATGAAPPAALTTRETETVAELVDYLLFVDEAPLGVVKGTSGFAEWFSGQGPEGRTGALAARV